MAVRFLIADDHEVMRRGLRSVLQQRPQWEVCGEAADGREAVQLVRELKPDVLILDVSMPGLGGLAAAFQIRQFNRDVKVVIFTLYESDKLADLARDAGAQAYVVKTQPIRDLIAALENVLTGGTFLRLDS